MSLITSITRNLILFLFVFAVSLTGAQTKRIFHKSHSGKACTFNKTITDNYFGSLLSNFGMAPTLKVKSAKLDSLIAINDTTVIMVTSLCASPASKKSSSSKLWKPGREILYKHMYFYKANSVSKMKNIIDSYYHFNNPANTVVFVGFKKT